VATQQDLVSLQKTVEKLDENQVARFAYTEAALDNEIIDGVEEFDFFADQNVPTKSHTDYDPEVLDKGVRSQGASFPRMGHNHFYGRVSYNLNLSIRKLRRFFSVLRRALAHNANEYDPQAEYAHGDVCYIVENSGDSHLYTWYTRVSSSPLYLVNVSPALSAEHWAPMDETTVANLLSDELPLMDGTRSAGSSSKVSRDTHVHPIDTSRAPNDMTLTDSAAASSLPASGTVATILQTVRNCLKWLTGAKVTLTGDVTATVDINGSAAATLAASGVTAAAYGDGGATRTLAFGGAFKLPKTLTIDAKGRVTAAEAITLTLPANPNTDNRGITQLTGDVTAPATTSGSAAATLAASGVTAAAYGDGGATRTLAFGGTFKIPKTLTIDAKGRVTAAEAITLTLPANPNTDNRGITQLTGDVTAPATTSGSAAATLAASGVTAGSYGDGGATRTLAFGGTFKIPKTLNIDAKGRVTAAEAITLTLPATPSASAVGAAPTAHASTATTYGVATTANYGHAMASSATPAALGTASAGTNANKFAQEGHAHPLPSPLAIANGGTGATTQLAARQNMGGVIPTSNPGTPATGYVTIFWSV
jgi:hypothetical protein